MSQGAAADPNLAARQRPDAPLGTLIFRAGLVPADALEEALEEGIKRGRRLGEILIERGLINETDLARILAGQKGLTYVNPTERTPDPEALALLTEEKAKLYRALPLGFEDGAPLVAITDPTNDTVITEVTDAIGGEPRFAVAARSELVEAIARAYGTGGGEGSGPAGGLRLAEPAVAVELETAVAAEHMPVVGHEPVAGHEAELAGPLDDAELPAELAPEIEPIDDPPLVTPAAADQPSPSSPPEPAIAPEPEPVGEDEPAVEAEPMFAPHLLRGEPVERRPAFAPEPAAAPEEYAVPEVHTPEPMFAPRVEATVEDEIEPQPEAELPTSVASNVRIAGSAPLAEAASGAEPEYQPLPRPELEHQLAPAAEQPAIFSEPAPAGVAESTVTTEPLAERRVFGQDPGVAKPEPVDRALATEPADPAVVARPGANLSPPPAPKASAESPPTSIASATEPCSVVLRLADGERVELGQAESTDAAWELARTFIRQLAATKAGDWPIVAGRFVRPDAIVSIEVEIDSETPV